MQHSGGAFPGVRGRPSGLGLRTYSANSSESDQRSVSGAVSANGLSAVAPGHVNDAPEVGDREWCNGHSAPGEESLARHSWSHSGGSPPRRASSSVRRLSPFADDAEQGAGMEHAETLAFR